MRTSLKVEGGWYFNYISTTYMSCNLLRIDQFHKLHPHIPWHISSDIYLMLVHFNGTNTSFHNKTFTECS